MNPISCYVVGSDTLLIECAAVLLEQGHDLRGVVTSQERIRTWCRERDVPVIDASTDWGETLRESDPFDVLFAITHLSIIPAETLALPRRLAVNFHDGPLPRYAGLNAPVWALLNRETEYGVSWHVMTSGVDEGPVLRQVRFPLAPGETAQSLNTRCMAEALMSFPELVARIAEGRETSVPQDLAEREVHRRFDRPPAACSMDWTTSPETLDALVRALSFGPHPNPIGLPKTWVPGARPFVVDSLTRSVQAADGVPGEILWLRESGIGVATGTGAAEITAARCLDGRPLTPEALQAGHGLEVGAVLAGPDSPLAGELDQAEREWARQEPFWTDRLLAAEPPELPVGRPDAPVEGRSRIVAPFAEPLPESCPPIGQVASEWLYTAVAVVLARLGEKDRVELAVPVSVDLPWDFYLPRVPLSITLDPKTSIRDLVSQVADTSKKLQARGSALRDLRLRVPGLAERGTVWTVGVGGAADPEAETPVVVFELAPGGEGIQVSFAWGPLSTEEAATLGKAVATCLEAALARPGDSWVRLPLTAEGPAGATHLEPLNDTSVAYDTDDTVSRQLLRQAARTPDRTAVFFEGATLTYRELSARAQAVAGVLADRGVGPGDLVGVHVDRSLELPVALLGVLLSGAAYLPLAPEFPADRIAYMIDDAGAAVVLTRRSLRRRLPGAAAGRILVLEDATDPQKAPSAPPDAATARPEDLAYVIYTSGSTGRPKGVLVEHRNVVSFFAAMDRVIPVSDDERVWLAVTSLSFDISVLELLWTLTRGFEVALHRDRTRDASTGQGRAHRDRPMAFGLFLWGNDDGPGSSKYRLMLEGAEYFDRNGFDSVWTPERHFHAFGGPFPNPSVTGAALAATTRNLRIRSGSCVSPLHHPIRIAEEWGVVDNLSDGRVGLAFAAGWQPNDFIIRPSSFGDQKAVMVEQIDTVRRLWRGEAVEFENPAGERVAVTSLPRPVQPELPVWVTTAGNVETYRLAGSLGANVLTHLLGQTLDEVGTKITAYREARVEAGLDPEEGTVTLMLHTFVGESDEAVREIVREPMKDYLRSSIELILGFAWTFPAFKRPGGDQAESPADIDLESLTDEEVEAILDFAFDRYFEGSGLFGTPATCGAMVDRCKGVGVDEIACLLDFGVDTATVLGSLPLLKQVREEANAEAGTGSAEVARPRSLGELIRERGVSHLQCTPSMARMVLQDPDDAEALRAVPHLFIGGEAFPESLAAQLLESSPKSLTNMYGPTETTIWSLTHRLTGPGPVPIGRPIANTRIHVLDRFGRPVPPGVPGHLWIAGDGVARGYHGRQDLSARRFVPDPCDPTGGRMYRTGDRVRVGAEGRVDFLGRVDHQVKLRGYRIELGEVEAALEGIGGVASAAVVFRNGDGEDPRMEAFVAPESAAVGEPALKRGLKEVLPDYMVPGRIVELDALPLTPNGKIDRKALPALDAVGPRSEEVVKPASELEERIAACWRTTLGRERVGVEDNFFDVGGHSLLVVRLHRELAEALNPAPSLVDLYRFPTIRALSVHLSEGSDTRHLQESRERAGRRRQVANRRRLRSS